MGTNLTGYFCTKMDKSVASHGLGLRLCSTFQRLIFFFCFFLLSSFLLLLFGIFYYLSTLQRQDGGTHVRSVETLEIEGRSVRPFTPFRYRAWQADREGQ